MSRLLRGGRVWVQDLDPRIGERPMRLGESVGFNRLVPGPAYDTVRHGRTDPISINESEIITLIRKGGPDEFSEYLVQSVEDLREAQNPPGCPRTGDPVGPAPEERR